MSSTSVRRWRPAAASSTPSSRYARTGSALPLATTGSVSSTRTASRTSSQVEWPSSTSPGRGGLLEPGRGVDRVAGRERAAGTRRPGHDRPGVDAGADLQADAEARAQLLRQRGDRLVEVVGGPHRAQGVVLAHLGHPEHREHRVADELLDGPAVALDRRPGHREVATHHRAVGLRVELLAQRGRAGHVGEQQGHRLADLAPGPGGYRRAALQAELGLVRQRGSTVLAPRAGRFRHSRTVDQGAYPRGLSSGASRCGGRRLRSLREGVLELRN